MFEIGAAIFIFILIAIFTKKQDTDPLAQEVFNAQEQQKMRAGSNSVILLGIVVLVVLVITMMG